MKNQKSRAQYEFIFQVKDYDLEGYKQEIIINAEPLDGKGVRFERRISVPEDYPEHGLEKSIWNMMIHLAKGMTWHHIIDPTGEKAEELKEIEYKTGKAVNYFDR